MVLLRRTLEMRNFTKLCLIQQKVNAVASTTAWAAPQNFKQQVLQKVHGGQSVSSVARELGISEGIIYQWKEKMDNHDNNRVSDLEKEVVQLRQQLRQAEMERDILKKSDRRAATAIFAKSG